MDSKKPISWMVALIAIAIIAVATVWIVRLHHPAATSSARPTATAAVYDSRLDKPDQTFSLVATVDKLVSGPADITVSKGESVRINLSTTSKDEFKARLDTYGVTTELSAAGPGGFSFIADHVGTFAIFTYGDNSGGKTPPTMTKIASVTVK